MIAHRSHRDDPPVVSLLERDAWERIARTFFDYSYRQSWAYSTLLAQHRRARCEYVAIQQGEDVLGIANVRLKTLPLGMGGLAYISWGPLVRRNRSDDVARFMTCLHALRLRYVRDQRMALRVDLSPGMFGPSWSHADVAAALKATSWRSVSNSQPQRTFLLDLSLSSEQLRKNLHQKWRNMLNQSERNDLTIRSGADPALFEAFCAMFNEFVRRKGFSVDLDAAFYQRVHANAAPEERFLISLAYHSGQAVAGHVASMLGDTSIYLLGATTPQGLKTKAAYLLQWHAILSARERGCHWYDLGGIDAISNPGVYHFKRGPGGVEIASPGAIELTPTGFSAHVTRSAERAYRIGRRLSRAWLASRQQIPATSESSAS